MLQSYQAVFNFLVTALCKQNAVILTRYVQVSCKNLSCRIFRKRKETDYNVLMADLSKSVARFTVVLRQIAIRDCLSVLFSLKDRDKTNKYLFYIFDFSDKPLLKILKYSTFTRSRQTIYVIKKLCN